MESEVRVRKFCRIPSLHGFDTKCHLDELICDYRFDNQMRSVNVFYYAINTQRLTGMTTILNFFVLRKYIIE